jgi:uncharacterized protein YutE (UPF0331/DUF86 family)
LAGVYGLTLTGFIFFRNELSREEFEDETLTDAVESLKARYFKVLLFITIFSLFTLLTFNIVISSESNNKAWVTTILMNIGQTSFFVNLLAITYFIFDVIAPKRIEKESKSLRQKVDPTSAKDKGSLETFLGYYNQIEKILRDYGQHYQPKFDDRASKYRRRISNVRLAEILLRAEIIDDRLFEDLKNLITLRNSIIHGAEPVVSKELEKIAENIHAKLSEKLVDKKGAQQSDAEQEAQR